MRAVRNHLYARARQLVGDREPRGGSLNLIQNPVEMVEIAVDKQATTILMPVTARRALNELPDEVWTKVNIEFYGDPGEGVFKGLLD